MSIKEIFNSVKLIFKVKSEVKKMEKNKAGWKTSEFWLTVISSVLSIYFALQGLIPAELGAKIVATVTMVYSIARAIAKFTVTTKDDELLNKIEEIFKEKQK